jgi:DNA-binding CsgD family transcriptional regulator
LQDAQLELEPRARIQSVAYEFGGAVNFTPREIEVLRWISSGKSDWQVGQILRISDKTVNFHVENMKRKLGVATRIQVVVQAVYEGKIQPAPPSGRVVHFTDRFDVVTLGH